jgi:hypothetical protein
MIIIVMMSYDFFFRAAKALCALCVKLSLRTLREKNSTLIIMPVPRGTIRGCVMISSFAQRKRSAHSA